MIRTLALLLIPSMLIAGPQEVLDYWFGDLENDPIGHSHIWFHGGEEVDREIESRFGAELKMAANGQLERWKESLKGRLALIILLDQFPRNIHRGTPEAFVTDPLALALALGGIERGDDRLLHSVERLFFYLPLEHSEDLDIQELSVQLYRTLGNEHALEYAIRHRDIIARFGRFPHRNAILGRQSTEAELLFLEEPNSSF